MSRCGRWQEELTAQNVPPFFQLLPCIYTPNRTRHERLHVTHQHQPYRSPFLYFAIALGAWTLPVGLGVGRLAKGKKGKLNGQVRET